MENTDYDSTTNHYEKSLGLGRKIAGGIKNGFNYVKNSRAGKFLYDPSIEGEAIKEILGMSAGGATRYQFSNAANRGKTKEETQRQITRRDAYLSKKHMLRDIVAHGVALAEGVGLEQLTENVRHHLSDNIRGVDLTGYGFPLIWKQVASTVTQNPASETTYQPWNLVGNAVIWTAVAEGVNYASLRLYDKYLSWKLKKELKRIEGNSK